ncbi:MAG: phosphoadenosine phosphosulfate reductase, partial [Pseudomonadota bacterium]
LSATIEAGLSGRLDLVRFSELYRARREYGPYLRTLLSEVEDLDRPKLVTWLAQSVLERKNMPRMRRALDRVMDQQRASRAPEQPAAE